MLPRVEKYRSFSDLPSFYENFFLKMEEQSVFFSRIWFERLCEHFLAEPTQLRLYGVETGDEVAALLFASASPNEGHPRFPSMKKLQGLTTTQSFRASLLVLSDENDSEVDSVSSVARLFAALGQDEESFASIDIDLLCISETKAKSWIDAIRGEGFLCHLQHQEWNRYEDVSDMPFSKMAKKSTKRRQKKLAKELELRFEMFRSPAEIEIAQAAYEDIYRRTWKQPDLGGQFSRALIADFAKRDWVRFLILYGDERPLAAECFFVHGKIASSFRTAYDLEYRDFSVGSIVLQRMLEEVMDKENVGEIDFGPGDEPYKQQWLSKRRKLWRIRAYAPDRFRAKIAYGQRLMEDELLRAKSTRFGLWLRAKKNEIKKS